VSRVPFSLLETHQNQIDLLIKAFSKILDLINVMKRWFLLQIITNFYYRLLQIMIFSSHSFFSKIGDILMIYVIKRQICAAVHYTVLVSSEYK